MKVTFNIAITVDVSADTVQSAFDIIRADTATFLTRAAFDGTFGSVIPVVTDGDSVDDMLDTIRARRQPTASAVPPDVPTITIAVTPALARPVNTTPAQIDARLRAKLLSQNRDDLINKAMALAVKQQDNVDKLAEVIPDGIKRELNAVHSKLQKVLTAQKENATEHKALEADNMDITTASTKLWHGAVSEIRNTPAGRGVQAMLAKKFNVSQATISQIQAGKTWTGVE